MKQVPAFSDPTYKISSINHIFWKIQSKTLPCQNWLFRLIKTGEKKQSYPDRTFATIIYMLSFQSFQKPLIKQIFCHNEEAIYGCRHYYFPI